MSKGGSNLGENTGPVLTDIQALQVPGLKMEATGALRGLVSEVRMMPNENAQNGHHIELAGELADILALGEAETTKPAQLARVKSVTMVARVRNRRYLRLRDGKVHKIAA